MGEGGRHWTSSDPGTWAAGQGPHHLPGNPSDGHFTPGGSHSPRGHATRRHLAGQLWGLPGGGGFLQEQGGADEASLGGQVSCRWWGREAGWGVSYRSRWGSGSEMTTVRTVLSMDQTLLTPHIQNPARGVLLCPFHRGREGAVTCPRSQGGRRVQGLLWALPHPLCPHLTDQGQARAPPRKLDRLWTAGCRPVLRLR